MVAQKGITYTNLIQSHVGHPYTQTGSESQDLQVSITSKGGSHNDWWLCHLSQKVKVKVHLTEWITL